MRHNVKCLPVQSFQMGSLQNCILAPCPPIKMAVWGSMGQRVWPQRPDGLSNGAEKDSVKHTITTIPHYSFVPHVRNENIHSPVCEGVLACLPLALWLWELEVAVCSSFCEKRRVWPPWWLFLLRLWGVTFSEALGQMFSLPLPSLTSSSSSWDRFLLPGHSRKAGTAGMHWKQWSEKTLQESTDKHTVNLPLAV